MAEACDVPTRWSCASASATPARHRCSPARSATPHTAPVCSVGSGGDPDRTRELPRPGAGVPARWGDRGRAGWTGRVPQRRGDPGHAPRRGAGVRRGRRRLAARHGHRRHPDDPVHGRGPDPRHGARGSRDRLHGRCRAPRLRPVAGHPAAARTVGRARRLAAGRAVALRPAGPRQHLPVRARRGSPRRGPHPAVRQSRTERLQGLRRRDALGPVRARAAGEYHPEPGFRRGRRGGRFHPRPSHRQAGVRCARRDHRRVGRRRRPRSGPRRLPGPAGHPSRTRGDRGGADAGPPAGC